MASYIHHNTDIDVSCVTSFNYIGLSLVSQYGWHILITVIILVVVWSRVKPYYYQWRKKQEELNDERNFDSVKAERCVVQYKITF